MKTLENGLTAPGNETDELRDISPGHIVAAMMVVLSIVLGLIALYLLVVWLGAWFLVGLLVGLLVGSVIWSVYIVIKDFML